MNDNETITLRFVSLKDKRASPVHAWTEFAGQGFGSRDLQGWLCEKLLEASLMEAIPAPRQTWHWPRPSVINIR